MNLHNNNLTAHWTAIEPILSIRNEREYDRAVIRMNALIDEIGDNHRHPLFGLLDTLGTVIHAYEEQHHCLPQTGGRQVLRFLLTEHGLKQSDIPELGSQGVVSEILRGRRELNTRQIKALSKRFGVSPAVFF